MVFSTVRSPSLKLSFSHMTFCPCGVIQSVSPFLLKVSSTYDMFPKSHMKYSLHQLIWVSSWKICCHCLSINWKRFNFLFNSFFSFWNLLELNCHCSINLLLLLVFTCSKIFEIHITHMGIILDFYSKTGISLCLEGNDVYHH